MSQIHNTLTHTSCRPCKLPLYCKIAETEFETNLKQCNFAGLNIILWFAAKTVHRWSINNNNNNNKIYLNSEHSRKLKAYQGQPRAKHMHTSIAPHLTIAKKAMAKLKI